MRPVVRVHGRSVASAVLLRCLTDKGIAASVAPDLPRPGPGAPQLLCINDVALSLLRDLFPALWRDGPPGYPLEGRAVLWSDDPHPRLIRQEALVIDARALGERLFALLGDVPVSDVRAPWEVNSPDSPAPMIPAGDRVMLVARVSLNAPLRPARSLMESLLDGWIFFAPDSDTTGIVQAMVPLPPRDPGAALDALLGQSTLVAPAIAGFGTVQVIPAAPGLRVPLAAPGRLHVGHPGARLDPVSGEGLPFALRTAILASAVIGHEEPEDALRHCNRRVVTSVLSHIDGCARFYDEAFPTSRTWRAELGKGAMIRAMLADLDWPEGAALRLDGLSLVPDALTRPLAEGVS